MIYDPMTKYTPAFFRGLAPRELQILFDEARAASNVVSGFKLIKKVTKDISSMRLILNGFDGIHNREHE